MSSNRAYRHSALALLLLLVFASTGVSAMVPSSMAYQGYLTNPTGSPVDGSVNATFRLYTVASGGSPIWAETRAVTVAQGLFTVELGTTPGYGFPVGLFDTPLFLGLTVGNDAEMEPRRALTSAAFSFHADEADLLSGKSAAQLDQSAHVASTSNPHAVTAAQTGAASASAFTSHTGNASAHHSRYANSEAVAAILAADGPGSGLDADLLDGVQGAVFSNSINSLSLDLASLQSLVVPNTGGTFNGTVLVNGSLGIGTTSPLAPVHLAGSTEALRIDGGNSWLSFFSGSLYDGFLWNNGGHIGLGTSHLNAAGNLRFYSYGQERMSIGANGRIGVGTSSPSYKLHVEDSGVAIHGRSTSNYGLYGYSSGQIGIYGYSNALGSAGIFGQSAYIGVEGITNAGSTDPNRQGIRGDNGGSATGWAGYFWGKVGVSGTLTKGGGAFRIDHPLDPENKYLYHSFVESPDMKNIYDGVVTTDKDGYAEVALPDWFDALNRDFRYQLTVIGQFAQAIVAETIHDNRFRIASSAPNVQVSWQVTGIRKDRFAETHRIPVEEDKPASDVGKYLHPDAFGLPLERAVDYSMAKTVD